MPELNPAILIWARETAGLAPEEAAKRLGFHNSGKSSATEKLEALEDGEKEPTRSQVLKMAEIYRRPLLTFYLSNPPAKGDRGADFRTLPVDHPPGGDALLDGLLRDIRARQSMLRAVLEDEEEAEPLEFVGSRRVEDGEVAVLASLRRSLGLELQEYRRQRNASAAFDLLRRTVETAGIFVLLKGDLGNYHTAIDTDIFRGVSIADEFAPFVVINDKDARPAWSFTLLHETVHLLLGQTGVGSSRVDNDYERFCDSIAGEFLLPRVELGELDLNGGSNIRELSERISEFADKRKLSRTMVAYNAFGSGLIKQETFEELRTEYYKQWRSEQARVREQAREQESGPNYYVVRRHRLGNLITDVVRRAMAENSISTSKAARILGVKARQVQTLLGAASP